MSPLIAEQGAESVQWKQELSEAHPCPVCGNVDAKTHVLDVENPSPEPPVLSLYRCSGCGTCYYHPLRMMDYRDQTGVVDAIRFYLEVGAGIDAMIEPLFRIPRTARFRSLLEVGCGYGFAVHYASRVLGWEALGVEPSPFGEAGRKTLGIDIQSEYFQRLLDSRAAFDVVYAAEVIEHVDDPSRLIADMASHTSTEGLLVLTTPNAEKIDQTLPRPTLLEILAPGPHLVLFSRNALEAALRQTGFEHVKIVERGHSIVAFASRKAVHLDSGLGLHRAYESYLERLSADVTKTDPLHNGISYRQFKEYVNRGEHAKARKAWLALESDLRLQYGEAVLDPKQVASMLVDVDSFSGFGHKFPFNLAGVHYYRGMLALTSDRQFEAAASHMRVAFDLAVRCTRIQAGFFTEAADLLWRAKYHEGLAHLVAGRRQEAKSVFEFIMESEPRADTFVKSVPREVLNETSHQLGIAELQLGNPETARRHFRRALAGGVANPLAKETSRNLAIAYSDEIRRDLDRLANFQGATRPFLRQLANLRRLKTAERAPSRPKLNRVGEIVLRVLEKIRGPR